VPKRREGVGGSSPGDVDTPHPRTTSVLPAAPRARDHHRRATVGDGNPPLRDTSTRWEGTQTSAGWCKGTRRGGSPGPPSRVLDRPRASPRPRIHRLQPDRADHRTPARGGGEPAS
jgi:hypothetical protein